jgi:low temperature requirement protein LtrA
MRGRDPHEDNRTATPLELLFDLTFVIAFGLGSSQFAHAVAEGHYANALIGFGFTSFGICWAWINFSWFASAYDTDDWIFRVATMVQMIGVLILALGVPRAFASLEHDQPLDNSIMVMGYVVMRVAIVFQWLRAAKQDPKRRRTCLTYAVTISVAQVGWAISVFLNFSNAVTFTYMALFFLIELAGPLLLRNETAVHRGMLIT